MNFFVQNAIKNKFKSIGKGDKKEHWMDYAKEDYGVCHVHCTFFCSNNVIPLAFYFVLFFT